MNLIFEFFFGQYSNYSTIDIVLEIVGVLFGFLSVWFSKQNNILVFPTGIVSTAIFVYLLFKWNLFGEMLINAYYVVMSVYGWYVWGRKNDDKDVISITKTNAKEIKACIFIFLLTLLFVYIVYHSFGKWTTWVAYVDTLATALFFVGMWLMAKRKLENWLLWIVGDLISVPLYFYKGYTFTSFQYLIFTFVAIFGYLAWKKNIDKTPQIV